MCRFSAEKSAQLTKICNEKIDEIFLSRDLTLTNNKRVILLIRPPRGPTVLGESLMTDARRIEQTFIPGPSIQLGNGEIVELSWQERALCAQTDPEAFFPEKGGSTREAKRVCLSCEVRQECLEYALAHDERFGIWGGLSERERRRLKRRPA